MSGSANRDAFVEARQDRWSELERLLATNLTAGEEWSRLAELYRALSADISRAQNLSLGEDVRAYLDELAGRAHNQLYGARPRASVRLWQMIASEFPRELRAQWRFFVVACLLFYGTFAIGFGGALVSPDFAPSVVPVDQLQGMEAMYSGGELARESGEDALMGGFYIQHNVGIVFQTFASGAIAGIGTMFFLVFNGLTIGTVFGYVTAQGHGVTIWTFACGHAAWELTGIVVAGTAGLRLGWALIDTSGLTRSGSLRQAGPSLVRLVLGAAALTAVAASIEGFWSAGPAPAPVKWLFALVQWTIVVAWLLFGGRRQR